MPDSRFVSGRNPLWRALRVLFVDDEVVMLRTVQRMLKRSRPDWRLVTVTSGELALEQLEQHPFHVMVTDVRLDGIQGATLLGLVRARHPDLVCIVHSTHVDTLSGKGLAHGFVTKPASSELLIRTIEDALGFDAASDEDESSAC